MPRLFVLDYDWSERLTVVFSAKKTQDKHLFCGIKDAYKHFRKL